MISPPANMITSAKRPLILRRRPDLEVTEDRFEGQRFFMVKDPVGLRYYRFKPEENCILELLDGKRSVSEIKSIFESRFKPQRVSQRDIQSFVGQLHEKGLLLSESRGQGEHLLERSITKQKKKLASSLMNPLYIKLPGFDPERLLQWLYPRLRWLFSTAGVGAAVLTMLSALLLVTVNFDEFRSRPELQSFDAYFNAHNIIWMWIAVGFTKVLHEFGHGLSCKHFGGECHEMGMLLLVFSPGMYCNVSDAWMLPNKWHRIWISAAGIYVELFLAAVATWVWWYTTGGMIHNLAFAVMFVGSINTFLVNANPLMRFDGYYVMSDWLEIPNLRQRSFRLFQSLSQQLCLGIEPPLQDRLRRGQGWFVVYATASYFYMWFISCAIVWFLYSFLKPYKLGVIGAVLAAAVTFSLFVRPVMNFVKEMWLPGRMNAVKTTRVIGTIAGLVMLVAAVLYVPIPCRVMSVMTIEPRQDAAVFVTVPGTLQQLAVRPGQYVEKGDILAVLENDSLRQNLEELTRQFNELDVIARTYLALDNQGEAAQMRTARDELLQEVKQRQQQVDRLTLRAPQSGWVMPPPELEAVPPLEQQSQLESWSRTPLHPENLGSLLETGTLFCAVGERQMLEAQLIIDQSDIEFVRQGQNVRMTLDALPQLPLRGHILEIAENQLEQTPIQVSSRVGGEVATRTDRQGQERPISAAYLANVEIQLPDESELPAIGMEPRQLSRKSSLWDALQPGLRGRARISCGTRTCGQWLWRFLTQTFRFSL